MSAIFKCSNQWKRALPYDLVLFIMSSDYGATTVGYSENKLFSTRTRSTVNFRSV